MIAKLTEQQKSDFDWFTSNRERLFEKYGTCVLVISNHDVIQKYDDEYTAVIETKKTREMGTFIVQNLTNDDSCYMGAVGGVYL